MGRGNITRRGKNSWRLKFDVGVDASGKRQTRYVTVKGKRQDAQRELTKLLGAADAGTLPEPSKTTIAEHLREWLGTGNERDDHSVRNGAHDLSPKTVERYRQLAAQQIVPHLGGIMLQKLRPATVEKWHNTLLTAGGKDGKPLSARTVGHAHRVLHKALQRAVNNETLVRNVASAIRPPKVEEEEVEILDAKQVALVLHKLKGIPLYAISALALASGMRRGELLAIRIGDVNFDDASVRVERSLEETAAGLRFKPPKSKHGRRTISLPGTTIAILRAHWRQQLELRMALGLGKPEPNALLFSNPDGSPLSPDNLSRDWRRACRSLGLPMVMFHALRHTHASALIASGQDVVQVSRRLGHGSPVITLRTYGHLFKTVDSAAAAAIDNVLRDPGDR
jgi:integrase